jgi:hypothetical protein
LWLALVYVDYKDRMPREDDMLKSAATRLRGYFQKLEWQQQEGETLGGRPAQRLTFQGEFHDEAMTGECLLLAHQGLAYWVFTWAPASSDQAALPDQWTEIRQGFTLLREREGWRGKVPRTAAIQGKKASYQLRYAEDIWSPLGTTGSADLVLLGRDPEDRKNALKTATITVYVRPVQPDLEAALKEARGLTEAKEKEVLPDTIMEPVPAGDKSGFPEGVVKLGQAKARVARLRIKSGEERGRFLALAVIPWTGCTLVIQCECAWTHLPSWEERFGPVLQSLSFSQSETSKDH